VATRAGLNAVQTGEITCTYPELNHDALGRPVGDTRWPNKTLSSVYTRNAVLRKYYLTYHNIQVHTCDTWCGKCKKKNRYNKFKFYAVFFTCNVICNNALVIRESALNFTTI